MLGCNPNVAYGVQKYYTENVQMRKTKIQEAVYRVAKVVQVGIINPHP